MALSVNRVPFTLIAVVLTQLLAADQQPTELSGRWRSLDVSSAGLGSILAFHPNGLVDFSPAAVVEGTYRIEGSEMIFPPTAIKGPEQRQKMEFVGQDQVRLAEVVFRRNGGAPDPSQPIVGEWVGRREMNGLQLEATYLFYPNSEYLFLLPFTTSPGRYSIQGSTMRLELPGSQVGEEFQIDGDMLTGSSPGGARYRFHRY